MSRYQTICATCAADQPDPRLFHCSTCGGPLTFRYDYANVRWDDRFRGNMWRYWPLLPVADPEAIVTLGEGGTPLLPSRLFDQAKVYLKDETRNPTGSHKDRPLSLAVNHARRIGAATSFVVSTGSTGISNAALAAAAGVASVVIMSEGAPAERVYPMFALGSTVVEVKGEIDDIIDEVIGLNRSRGLYVSSTSRASNPYQGEGNKTIAFEIVEQLGTAPDWVVVPVGGGGTISGIWRGFQDLLALGWIDKAPRLVGVLPQNYNLLETAWGLGLETWDEVLALPVGEKPPSILVKLAHVYPPDGMDAIEAVRASGGRFVSISDEAAVAAQMRFSRAEGLYIEPSTGVCPAALELLLADGVIRQDETVVALICGSGFRETFLTMQRASLVKRAISAEELEATLVGLA